MTGYDFPVAWSTRSVAVRGATITAQAAGEPTADPAVVLLGGSRRASHWWPDAFCAELVDAGVRVVRFDPRDTGEPATALSGGHASPDADRADDALAAADAFGAAHVVVLGVSSGGVVAQRLAAQHPDRVVGLVLMSTTVAGDVDGSALTSLPSVVVHGSADSTCPLAHGEALAEAIDAPLIVLTDVGHAPPPPRTWPSLVPAILGVVRDARDGEGL
ncbi:alpha/beta fold hydrolase [Microbacterium sp. A1-JK]|uniref:alpha/beta fold hydrolase n=1 Tax=Microbacterium sp. A1-JK TaxID=3177516 RepID=UPI003887ABD6